MITDLDMNGTISGAVEQFNLCTNLRTNDALFAECIRSFPTVTVDANQWLHRLEVEVEAIADMQVSLPVPATRKPHVRSIRSKAPWADIYGFRPLDTPFGYLSGFEFLRYWSAEALSTPSTFDPCPRTKWTKAG